MVYYAVRGGLRPGVYDSWDIAKQHSQGVPGALCKKFQDEASAVAFANAAGVESTQPQLVQAPQLTFASNEGMNMSFGTPSDSMQAGRSFLDVPYSQKDEAKALGAKWDPNQRKWYAESEHLLPGLSRWLIGNSNDSKNVSSGGSLANATRNETSRQQTLNISRNTMDAFKPTVGLLVPSEVGRTYLEVPYAQKDDAKSLGAKWDASQRKWYADSETDLTGLSRWLPDVAQANELALYTDGACKGNKHVATNACPAGWGVAIIDGGSVARSSIVAELFGPVVIDSSSPFFLGAEVCSNNTGELSAICEALLWLLHHEPSYRPVAIFYDSDYAAKITTGRYRAQKNQNLAAKAQSLLDEVRQKRSVRFEHVKGHSKNKWNDAADALANRGSTLETCVIGRYANRHEQDSFELPSAKRARLGNA